MADSKDRIFARAPENAPFWQASAEGRLVLPRCADCGTWVWLPRGRCMECGSLAMGWDAASGHGSVHSFATMHREDPPVTHAVVLLNEGVAMVGHILTASLKDIHIGMSVRCRFQPLNGVEHAVLFEPETNG